MNEKEKSVLDFKLKLECDKEISLERYIRERNKIFL